MTPQQQRIALAEWAGWKRERDWNKWARNEVWTKWTKDGTEAHESPPNYLQDLNLTHLLEDNLTEEQKFTFIEVLEGMLFEGDQNYETWWNQIHATAAQRCEALLRTLNLWKD